MVAVNQMLSLLTRFTVKIVTSGRIYSNTASDWLAAVLAANK